MSHKFASTSREGRAVVVKFGGAAMDAAAEEALAAEVASLPAMAGGGSAAPRVAIVHGGGPEIDAALAEAGVTSERVDGLRVTSPEALAITERVLCGTINKRLVRAFLAHGVPAVGITGMDAGLLQARRLAHLGFVGDIVAVRVELLDALFAGGFFPVIAPLALERDTLQALNVNADTAAAAIAAALHAESFVLKTNVARVRADASDARSGIDALSLGAARDFAASPACEGSMRPKMLAAIDAVASGVSRAIIGSSSIARMLSGDATIVSC